MNDLGGKETLFVGNDETTFVLRPAVKLFKISEFLGVSMVKLSLVSDFTIALHIYIFIIQP